MREGILATGGSNKGILRACEYYEINKNKWVVLTSLTRAWIYPAAFLLPSKKAFCFCGSNFY